MIIALEGYRAQVRGDSGLGLELQEAADFSLWALSFKQPQTIPLDRFLLFSRSSAKDLR
jgi:hypothetical protein